MAEYIVREEGKNGSVTVLQDRIVRTIKKRIGKDDVVTIPVKAVVGVFHNRKSLGTDEVVLDMSGGRRYEWKVKNAEAMVEDLHSKLYESPEPAALATDPPAPARPDGQA